VVDRPSLKEEFERLLQERSSERYVLKLYVTGMTPRSTEAVAMVKGICEDLLPGRHDLEVIDLYEDPRTASLHQVVAAPTLVRQLPLPVRRLVGNLSDRVRVLEALNLSAPAGSEKAGA
jgi:circadian clock protein KaiB